MGGNRDLLRQTSRCPMSGYSLDSNPRCASVPPDQDRDQRKIATSQPLRSCCSYRRAACFGLSSYPQRPKSPVHHAHLQRRRLRAERLNRYYRRISEPGRYLSGCRRTSRIRSAVSGVSIQLVPGKQPSRNINECRPTEATHRGNYLQI